MFFDPANKEPIGRLSRNAVIEKLRNRLDFNFPQYQTLEQSLVDNGTEYGGKTYKLARKRGRCGGLFLVEVKEGKQEAHTSPSGDAGVSERQDGQAPEKPPGKQREEDFYKRLVELIQSEWKAKPGMKAVFVHETARQGRRQTGGRWTRPDITVLTVSKWSFSSIPEGHVRTIEVKKFDALDRTAIFEALAHRAKAHFAYLAIVDVPDEIPAEKQKSFEEILEESARYGIGIITLTKEWRLTEELVPTLSNSNPEDIDDFLINGGIPSDKRREFENELGRQLGIREM